MKEQLISLETAKIAKEKGFDWTTHRWYYHTFGLNGKKFSTTMGESFYSNHSERGKLYYNAPTQSFLQKWLRDEHGWHIIVIPVVTTGYTFKITRVWPKNFDPNTEDLTIETPPYKGVDAYDYSDYEEALEAGLVEGLKLINVG